MSNLVVHHPTGRLFAAIPLPASKSICNRALVLQQVLGNLQIGNLSDADDSRIMKEALAISSGTVDVKNAGTCMRFLAAYYASVPGTDITLHGTERMHRRPVAALVDALRQLGADIDYIDQPGFPPLRIRGKKLAGGVVSIDGSVSSQFTSGIMLAAPLFTNGLVIRTGRETVSKPYIVMTARLMQQCGVQVSMHDDIVIRPYVFHGDAATQQVNIESDWSAAGYWYSMLALANEGRVELAGLGRDSLQGDAVVAGLMEGLGVHTAFEQQGAVLTRQAGYELSLAERVFPMADHPDLVPALAVLMCAWNIGCRFVKVGHLAAKESNRLAVLASELGKCGFDVTHRESELVIRPVDLRHASAPPGGIDTHDDHRMAMAFAPLALLFGSIRINDPSVVEKSYPGFWVDLKRAGFLLDENG